jgi:hypothetical protein
MEIMKGLDYIGAGEMKNRCCKVIGDPVGYRFIMAAIVITTAGMKFTINLFFNELVMAIVCRNRYS